MPDYTRYTIEEFAQDNFFRAWVQQPTAEANTFWSAFLEQYPEKQSTVLAAKVLLKAVSHVQILPTQQQGDHMWELIEQRIQPVSKPLRSIEPGQRQIGFRWGWLVAAASIVMVLGVGYWLTYKPTIRQLTDVNTPMSTEAGITLLEKINNTDKPLTVQLTDGSRIILQPNSRLRFPKQFLPEKRDVQLVGEGFFEVSKNPKQPFFVFANELVTQVVGTSFTIKAPMGGNQVNVMVRTGKVAVFTLKALQRAQASQKSIADMLLLTPNQQALFDKSRDKLTKSLITEPLLLKAADANRNFQFENAPVSQVFETLEDAYGVTIKYNMEALSNCSVTAPLNKEPLFRKLDLICQTIGATYEVWGTDIIINGKGCL